MSKVEFEVIFFSILTIGYAFVSGSMLNDGDNVTAVVLLVASIFTLLTALSEVKKI